MTTTPYVVDELISAKAIAARVEALAKEIATFYSDTDKLVVVGLLRGSFIFIADLVLLAIGFAHPIHEGMLAQLGARLDPRGNLFATTKDYKTTIDKVYAAGDMRRGQSLVVWAIREGRQAARAIDKDLMGKTDLPR